MKVDPINDTRLAEAICKRCLGTSIGNYGESSTCGYCEQGYRPSHWFAPCGLNADWCVLAWTIKGGNGLDGSTFLVDNEDGTYSVVARYYVDSDPRSEHYDGDSYNDDIQDLGTYADVRRAIVHALGIKFNGVSL